MLCNGQKENSLGRVTPKWGGGYAGKGGRSGKRLSGDPSLGSYMHTKFEVSSFSSYGDMRVITHKITDWNHRIAYCLIHLYRRAEA